MANVKVEKGQHGNKIVVEMTLNQYREMFHAWDMYSEDRRNKREKELNERVRRDFPYAKTDDLLKEANFDRTLLNDVFDGKILNGEF